MNGSKTLRLDYITGIVYHVQILLFVIVDKLLQNAHMEMSFFLYFQAFCTQKDVFVDKIRHPGLWNICHS